MEGGTRTWDTSAEKLRMHWVCACHTAMALAGAVVSKPMAKKTTFLPGLARAIFRHSSGEFTIRISVPGSRGDLFQCRGGGGDMRMVDAPLGCLKFARANPGKKVVFFAIGFETTAPANAMAVWQAQTQCIRNFSALVSHVRVPPSITSILQSPANRVQAFLGPGHVCAVMGYREYEPIAARYRVPIAITGFEPVDLLEGTLAAVRQLEQGRYEVENPYARAVTRDGNIEAQKMISRVFQICDRSWRGIGIIPKSGYRLSYEFRDYDAERIFEVES